MPLAKIYRSRGSTTAVYAIGGEQYPIQEISDLHVTCRTSQNGALFTLPLSRKEVLSKFYSRASKEETCELKKLLKFKSQESLDRALQLVVLKLNSTELWRVGVYTVGGSFSAPQEWCVASGKWEDGTNDAVGCVLDAAHVDDAECSGGFGGNWFVSGEQFVRARRALLNAKDRCVLGDPILISLFQGTLNEASGIACMVRTVESDFTGTAPHP